MMIKGVFFATLVGLSLQIYGKKFSSQFCEFELPPGWECALEGTEWVCQSTNEERKKEAIIILAAKERGSQDSLDQYQSYLKGKKKFDLPGGKTIVSDPSYTKSVQIANHTWIDSLHLQSEIPGFYTRYLATVKEGLGVAVTFSVAKDHYAAYLPVFDRIIEGLKVFAPSKLRAEGQFKLAEGQGSSGEVEFLDDQGMPSIAAGQGQKERSPSAESSSQGPLLLILLLLGAGGFFVFKLRKKKT